MDKIIVIAGPTAVGKTDISIKLAKQLNGEIISADSMQIYKHMDIGSAKISLDEMEGIPHHLIDIIEPTENFTAAEFKTRAEIIIEDIKARGKQPIIAGGTGLYIDSLLSDFSFTDANKDDAYRLEMEELAKEKGNVFVHELLKEIDMASYENIHYNNLKRVIRALEVHKLSGKPFSEYKVEQKATESKYITNYFVLNIPREQLYSRINQRVDLMMDKGLLQEVVNLKKLGLTSDMQSMKGIGYKELLFYLQGELSLEEAVELIKKGSRNYAKRQLTWFRKNKATTWIDKNYFKSDEKIVDFLVEKYNS